MTQAAAPAGTPTPAQPGLAWSDALLLGDETMDEVRALVAQGDMAHVPSLAAAPADWFPRHAQHLDSALATWMCKQRWGARPVVLRRSVASTVAPARP